MRDSTRINLMLEGLRILWNNSPDLRLTQLLAALADAGGWTHQDLFYCEDDLLLAQIEKAISAQLDLDDTEVKFKIAGNIINNLYEKAKPFMED